MRIVGETFRLIKRLMEVVNQYVFLCSCSAQGMIDELPDLIAWLADWLIDFLIS